MKRKLKIVLILFSILLISCNPFHENRVLEHENELLYLISKLEKYENGTYSRDEIDEFIIENVRDLDIDFIVKNSGKKNPNYSGFIEESDSLIIFIKRSDSMLDNEKRIIYDFNKTPRNFGNDTITLANYRLIQLKNRWYYSEEGFD
jgi:hypothetical protein